MGSGVVMKLLQKTAPLTWAAAIALSVFRQTDTISNAAIVIVLAAAATTGTLLRGLQAYQRRDPVDRLLDALVAEHDALAPSRERLHIVEDESAAS